MIDDLIWLVDGLRTWGKPWEIWEMNMGKNIYLVGGDWNSAFMFHFIHGTSSGTH
jgi:hypothetical protein